MGKYLFNDVFKEIVDTYDIDSTILGSLTDRDSSRIRHYKTDSKPVRSVLELLINSISMIINETNDPYINSLLMDKLNKKAAEGSFFTNDIQERLLQIKDIQEYVPFILRRSLELNNYSVKAAPATAKSGIDCRTIVTKVTQAHHYFESNLYQDALNIYQNIVECPSLTKLPEQSLIIHTDLGLIYRNSGMSQYDIDTIRLAIKHLKFALKLVTDQGDQTGTAVINKYLGTVYMSLSFLEDAEPNLKRAIHYFDISLGLLNEDNPEEYAKVLINYGNLFIHYSNIRNSRKFLNNAASYLEQALDFYKNTSSYFEGLIYLHCSSTYSLLSEISNTKENAEKAIQNIQNALRIFTIEDYPLFYAQCVSNLGLVHMIMAQYDNTIDNCNIAISHISHALSIITEKVDTYSYFIAHLNLSSIYILLVNTTKDYSYLDKAISSIEECEKHKIPRINSMNNIKTTLNHAETLIALSEVKKDMKLLEEAEAILTSAVEISSNMKYDYLMAMSESLLAKLYYVRFELTKNKVYLDDVLAHSNTAIDFFSIQENPLYHAYVSHLIAKACRYKGEYERSKQIYEIILNIFTRERYTEKHKLMTEEYYDLCKEKGWQIILRL